MSGSQAFVRLRLLGFLRTVASGILRERKKQRREGEKRRKEARVQRSICVISVELLRIFEIFQL